MTRRPILALTMGDPAGVGSEVIVKALSVPAVRAAGDPVVFGDRAALEAAIAATGLASRVVLLDRIEDAALPHGLDCVPTIAVSSLEPGSFGAGRPSLAADRAQLAYIEAAVAQVRAGAADAVVTAPISKASIARAGSPWPGHTEMLAALCGPSADGRTPQPVMMIASERLKVVPLTVHLALRDVPQRLSFELVLNGLRVTHAAFVRHFSRNHARLGVAGLNPHAGEGGLFGDEEMRIIRPAIEAACAEGINALGPFSGDTVFRRALEGEFDAVLGMYHDQALIPIKTLDFDNGVNVTLGLPIIRTSVDHGTAYDIAGKGVASASSMIAALTMAAAMVPSSSIA